jgi:hypothetical protein
MRVDLPAGKHAMQQVLVLIRQYARKPINLHRPLSLRYHSCNPITSELVSHLDHQSLAPSLRPINLPYSKHLFCQTMFPKVQDSGKNDPLSLCQHNVVEQLIK